MSMVNVAQKGKRKVVTDYFGRPFHQVPIAERRRCVTGYHLRYVVEAMVRGITAKVIRHYYGGSGAATTDHLMLLPRIPQDYLFTLREQHIILGYAAHEICHQLYTHFSIMEKIFPGHKDDPNFKPTKRQKHLKAFWNAIEDYRIEKVCKPDYPGFPLYINVTRDHSAEKFLERVENGEVPSKKLSNPFSIGAVALTWVGARLNRYKTQAPEQALAAIDPQLREWIESWEEDLSRVSTNQDSLDLAGRIIESLYSMSSQSNEEDLSNSEADESDQGSPDQNSSSCSQNDDSEDASNDDNQSNSSGKEDGTPSESEPSDQAGDNNQSSSSADEDEEESSTADKGDEEDQAEKDASDEEDTSSNGQENPEGSSDESDQQTSESDDGNDEDGAISGEEDDQASESNSDTSSDSEEDAEPECESDTGNCKSDPNSSNSQQEDDETVEDGSDERVNRPHLDIDEDDDEEEPESADLDIEDVRRQLEHVPQRDEAEDAEITSPHDIGNGIDREQVAKDGALAFSKIRSSVGSAAARSAGIVRRMLQARNTTRIARGQEDGSLDFERVVGMAMGDSTVYKKLSKRVQQNTALTLLLDNSGSMRGDPLKVCQETAVVLDMAVTGTKTATEIVGFTSSWHSGKAVLYQYRTFDQKGATSASSLGNMTNVTLGGTPVAVPLLDTIRRMMPRPEERKIIIVVSDGGAEDPEKAANARVLAESLGFIVVGISIGSSFNLLEMKKWCDKCHGISSFDELPLALTRIVQEIMR